MVLQIIKWKTDSGQRMSGNEADIHICMRILPHYNFFSNLSLEKSDQICIKM